MKGTFSDDQWMENFRMTKATVKILCDDLRPSFPDQTGSVREPLQLDHRVAIAVYWVASSAEYRTIANLFVLENQQYINASMMSAQHIIFWTNM